MTKQTKQATILRKRGPFHCRRVLPSIGKMCLVILTDTDGDFCPPCAEADKKAKEKFFEKPLAPVSSSSNRHEDRTYKRFWP